MADHQYLSIGEVLGLLLEDFPDVTISKIRFLETQGLIEPERTPSGYRKFYDADVELLRAILHEQKENFLPLKVIRDRIESGAIDSDSTGGRTPPRGIRNVEQRDARTALEAAGQDGVTRESQPTDNESRDSVFRRTDGGPEWAGGQALIPGETNAVLGGLGRGEHGSGAPITAAVPVTPAIPSTSGTQSKPAVEAGRVVAAATVIDSVAQQPAPVPKSGPKISQRPASAKPKATVVADLIEPLVRPDNDPARVSPPATPQPSAVDEVDPAPARSRNDSAATVGGDGRELPYSRDELCKAASITAAQLTELLEYSIVSSRGTGLDTSFPPDAVGIASIAGQLLAQGIDARHLRAWRQAAERESALFEQRIMPLLRQRNPQARQSALSSLSELSGLGARLHDALVDSLLRHHFDGA